MKKLIFILSILLISINAFGYINIYPSKFEKDIKEGAYEEFTLYNRTQRNLKYRIYLEDLPGEKSMGKWIELYPRSISLKPLEEKTIKVFVKAPRDASKGKYTSNLIVKEIEEPTMKKRLDDKKVQLFTLLKLKLNGYIN